VKAMNNNDDEKYKTHQSNKETHLNQIQNNYGVSISIGKVFKMKSGGFIILVLL
jgi:hypothetical protein